MDFIHLLLWDFTGEAAVLFQAKEKAGQKAGFYPSFLRVVLFGRCAQGRPVDFDGRAFMLEAIKHGIDKVLADLRAQGQRL